MNETALAIYTVLLGAGTMLFATPLLRYFIDKTERKIILKGMIPKNIKSVRFTPEIEEQINNYNPDNISEVYRDSVKLFLERIEKNFDKDSLKFLRRNISSLSVSKYNEVNRLKFHAGEGTGAAYWVKENKVIIYEYDDILISIFHELLHMSSSIHKDGINYSGFSQTGPRNFRIGNGLNEGYTQLLCKRYFSDQKISDSYPYFVHYAKLLERIVGKDRMQSYYMSADLRSLIEDLKQYSSEEEIMRFINNLDFIFFEVGYFTSENHLVREELTNIMQEISSFIVNAFIEKYKDSSIRFYKSGQYDRMIKSKEEFNELIKKVIDNTFDSYTFFKEHKYDCSIRDEKHMEEFATHINEAWESIESVMQTKSI